MSDWGLAIDFGTSFTATAIVHGGSVEVVPVEDEVRFPSWVLAGEDGFVVGRAALTQARTSPERFERSPKRLVGQPAALLGHEAVKVVDLVAAVLRRVFEAACTRQGNTAPAWVRLTHPAIWQQERLEILRAAARTAGLGDVELMSEPEAAAWFFVNDRRGSEPVVDEGQSIAMYDLGGGTFDTAILRRDEDGFSLAGQPGGDDWFGGEDLDQRLLDHVLRQMKDRDPNAARQLAHPLGPTWQRARLQLQRDVRDAKEALSSTARVSVPVPGDGDVVEIEVTRAEFEDLIREDLQRTVAVMESTIHRAGLERDEVVAIYMTGGSSRIPLAAALLAQFHARTYTRPDPKTVVVRGAASVGPGASQSRAAPAVAPAAPAARAPDVQEAPLELETAGARSPAAPPAGSTRGRSRGRAIGGLVVLAGAIAGIGVAAVGGGGSGDSSGPARPVTSTLLTLEHPHDWHRSRAATRVPGLRLTDGVSLAPETGSGTGLVAGISDARGPLLLPRDLADLLPRPPSRNDRVGLGELQAYRYRRLKPRGSNVAVTIYASPTSLGVVTIGCFGRASELAAIQEECERIAGSVRLRRGKPYPLGPDSRYARAIDDAIDSLNRGRTTGRRRLDRAGTSERQADAADSLARTHRAAARALARVRASPLDAPGHDRLVAALRGGASGYSELAAAARRRDAEAFSTAARRVRGADARLGTALGELRRAGYRIG